MNCYCSSTFFDGGICKKKIFVSIYIYINITLLLIIVLIMFNFNNFFNLFCVDASCLHACRDNGLVFLELLISNTFWSTKRNEN